MNRRAFLRQSGLLGGGAVAGLLSDGGASPAISPGTTKGVTPVSSERGVSIIRDPADPVASGRPVQWAVGEVREALSAHGIPARLFDRLEQAPAGDRCLLATGGAAPLAQEILTRLHLSVPDVAEALALAGGRLGDRKILLAAGHDDRGLMHALLEMADRVALSRSAPAAKAYDLLSVFDLPHPIVERPATPIRSAARLFVSEVEDKSWFHDRSFWPGYLSMLAAQRFNRFALTFGIGYDFLKEVSDAYLHFAYPFLLAVPGYNVRAAGLPDAERARNLETLRFISETAMERGLHFQLGLWTHGYDYAANPGVNYPIEGLTQENHAAYCRDALRMLLQACPAIQGVTFRIHGESGVPEAHYGFWKTVFEGIVQCGRKVEIDMHAKGIDPAMIDVALETGMPVKVSPKYWAEHMGLPYHQAAIRSPELPRPERQDEGFFAKSSGSRSFLRYGYGDLLSEDRHYGVIYRLWPGTQRFLLWGDPSIAAAYARASTFCGSLGMELCEPLSFKGRKGSGRPGGRNAYADASLKPAADWEKYRYTYRLWGRLLYNPESPPETWRRFLSSELGEAAGAAEAALAHASRILPLLTTAHLPSAANNSFWPEIYTNMPLLDEKRPHPYGDTPSPKRFGAVSPLDPELFSRIDDFAEELLSERFSGKYSPLEVAHWLQELADNAARHLAEAEAKVGDRRDPAFRRMAIDVALQSGLGRFFAAKLRAGVLAALYTRSGDETSLREAIKAYRVARAAWAELSAKADGTYVGDITFGRVPHLRGHWADRLEAIDQDIADLEKRVGQAPSPGLEAIQQKQAEKAIRMALSAPYRPRHTCSHALPPPFRPGQPVVIEATLGDTRHELGPIVIHLHYRRVNQAEPYRIAEMQADKSHYRAIILREYTDSRFPLQYYFELRDARGQAWLHPGFAADLCSQPYFVVRPLRQSVPG
jgi:hypothetical protein